MQLNKPDGKSGIEKMLRNEVQKFMISSFGKGRWRVGGQRSSGFNFGVFAFGRCDQFEQIKANRLGFRLVESEKRGVDSEKLVRCFAMMLRYPAVMVAIRSFMMTFGRTIIATLFFRLVNVGAFGATVRMLEHEQFCLVAEIAVMQRKA